MWSDCIRGTSCHGFENLSPWNGNKLTLELKIVLCAVLCLVTQSCPSLCDPMDYSPTGSFVLGNSSGKNTDVGCHALLQGIFPTQGLNPGLLHCRWIIYHLSHREAQNWRFSSVQSHSCVWLFATPWIAARQASLSITNSQSPPKPLPIESVMPSSHLILCRPLLLLPSIFPSIRIFSNESALCMRWPKYWSFSFNISPSNEHPGLISFRMNWLDLLAVQGTLKSLLQHRSSKAWFWEPFSVGVPQPGPC